MDRGPDARRCDGGDSQPVGSASNQWLIFRLGKAWHSAFIPVSVTSVRQRLTMERFVSLFKCTRPASVIRHPERSRSESLVSPTRCASPASVTRVSLRLSSEILVKPLRWTS